MNGSGEDIHEEIDRQRKEAKEEERKSVVRHIRNRINYWGPNSNVNKAVKRLADEIENEVHHRIQRDVENNEE